ncbi:serine hydrolase domain-containing protein [Flagellimonas halotolerans]|uniref:Serine hydrolase domain-containing protein n=1 Tax=Flagellimonas halotolerans TaxID=3112164 RepID=A0ABU6IQP7_9FLAO|nr:MULTISPECIES: serine hydrolase domain-containing protein [unclassified Allomuricauda]MEC3965478.1 serine hydrolase domain-containing protein [Muricauda sp. SYSU M86414]MEC4265344.1 serine hydrolase domain-containing protein [Muricauda sp. SYSU M84420]
MNGGKGLEQVDIILHNLITDKKVPGLAITIMDNGGKVLQKGYGFADLENRDKVDPKRTVFRIASISKCITGLALGKMVEDGIVDLDESFYTYVPYYPKKKYDFTLRQLASHTAGIRGYRGKEYALNQNYSIKDGMEIFKNDPLFFEPGTSYLYNSFDFVLLSLAMQEASGISFQQYIKDTILMPLGLETTFPPQKDVSSSTVENIAQFYTKKALGFKEAVEVNNTYKLAGGGYLSTCDDVAQLGQAILERKLLKAAIYDELLASQIIDGKPTYYGLGFQVSQDAKGRPFYGHVGNSVGTYTNLFVYPNDQKVVSILINCTDPKVQKELDLAIDAIFDGTV